MMTNIPRPEFPNPQWERQNWMNLNGKWEFDFDFGVSALERKVQESAEPLAKEINVPFCPESRLSGIGYVDFIPAVCYRRHFSLSGEQLCGLVYLHFGAVDYETTVFVNGKNAGGHVGGYTSFALDVTDLVTEGENTLFVYAKDDVRSKRQPKGKQANKFYSSGCDYTRTTGIWQTVWLEFLPKEHVRYARYYPDIHESSLTVVGETVGKGTLTLASSFEGKDTGAVTVEARGGYFKAVLKLTETHLWELGKGGLYDLTLTFGDDTVKSYFGLREVRMDGMKFLFNDRSVFQRTVLDQGFYPEGIYTAPTEADLEGDIHLSMNAGFNGARLHQKVFEPRFLYHADRLGYMVWGEYPNWGLNHHDPQATEIYLNEWRESMERDFNHPAIIGWCPFNETWGYIEQHASNTLLSTLYYYTKAMDYTRPCIDTSGNYHAKVYGHNVTDIYDVHDYNQDPVSFKANYDRLPAEGFLHDQVLVHHKDGGQSYEGEAVFISEYGGIQWNTDGNKGWGYGVAPKTAEEFLARYKGLTDAMLDNPCIMGFCYTQLTDIEQEINGLYTYNRVPKFDIAFFKEVNSRKAAIED